MFVDVQLNSTVLKKAHKQADMNWRWWQDDFEHNGSFGEMPIFNDYPRFLGFGFDYSVFRGFSRNHLENLQEWLRAQPDPQNFEALFVSFSSFANSTGLQSKKQRRVSFLSKVLCLWRPEKYAMWDTLARKGLKKIHDNTHGHCYWDTNPNNYHIFQEDFFKLHESIRDQLTQSDTSSPTNTAPTSFSLRILDSYLMEIAK